VGKLVKITELSKILDLVDQNTRKPQNYTLRFWETKFRQIKPKIINKQRYYSIEQVELIKFIKYLIKDKGMTINGVKNVLNFEKNKLDDNNLISLKIDYNKIYLKKKIFKVLKKIEKLREYGKKNTR